MFGRRYPAGALCSLTVTVLLVTPALADGAHVEVDTGTIVETDFVSGFPSHQNYDLRQPGNDALLVGIGGNEKSDKPCYLELTWSRQNDDEHEIFKTRWHRDPCKNSMGADKEVVLANPSPAEAIAGIRVCTNEKDNKRLKGIEITEVAGLYANGAYQLPDFEINGSFNRTNCKSTGWDGSSTCRNDYAAVGVKIYHDKDGISGLELICAIARKVLPPKSVYTLEIPEDEDTQRSKLTGIAGNTLRVMIGTNVDLPNDPLRYYGITEIQVLEDSDKPCRVILFGGALDADKGPDTRKLGQGKIAGCDPGKSKDKNTFHAKVSKSPHHFVHAVKACVSITGSGRLKGLGLQPALVQAAVPPLVDKTNTVANGGIINFNNESTDQQANCYRLSFEVENYVYCTLPSIAVGVLMHHDGEAFTGLELVCRDVTSGPYTTLKKDKIGY